MHIDGYYSTGEFAKLAGVTVRTIRFYDKQNILKPSYLTPAGARFYTQEDLGRLQQILLLKYLGLSLDDIKELTIADDDYMILRNQLEIQQILIQDKIEQMQLVQKALENTIHTIDKEGAIDWQRMQDLIHLTNMENTLKSQYQNSNNVNSRIRLHSLYATNKQGWFPWVYDQCHIEEQSKEIKEKYGREMRILEIGCGNGSLWTENAERLPENVQIFLTDKSQGMIRDARRNIQASFEKEHSAKFKYQVLSADKLSDIKVYAGIKTTGLKTSGGINSGTKIIVENAVDTGEVRETSVEQFDLIIANHVLFYFDDIEFVLKLIKEHLTPNGHFICSTYGENHMREIRELAKEFDERISLSGDVLYEKFGLQNGAEILGKVFGEKTDALSIIYPDELIVTEPEPLLEYIMSCHGNQNQYLLDRYKDFRAFLERKVNSRKGCHITKEAGVFYI